MKLNHFILVISSVTLLNAQERQIPDALDIKMLRELGRGSNQNMDLSWLDEKTGPIVIERLLRRLETPDSIMPDPRHVEAMLVSINHVETIQRLIAIMHKPWQRNGLYGSATEKALPYLIPELDKASSEIPSSEPDSDIIPAPPRELFCITILDIIYSRAVFPEETRQWAKSMRLNISEKHGAAQADLIKLWWEKNKTAILEKRYADAIWLPRYKGRPSDLGSREQTERENDRKLESAARMARREKQVDTRLSEHAASTPSSVNWPAIVTGCISLALVMASLWWLTRRLASGGRAG